ncbi:archaellin/type IV pilin N-terminal domain-containing protein [uncultured Methanolobus sp.]|uniref:archaellin/type IV pilin N-terminal domain-containing protein n=1 Tax=uncultured Methanolobus sp. TaxID=218300 RepID=UPI0029C7AFE7|nr:archaellin/type IV pilin N-terminal domain-containing protein [uncultured Methanolobus sp.]
MKANKSLNMKQNTRAQVGIGTLIIFIAMVLVAAVAAAVLIQTSGILQQKAQSTGKQSTQEVSSNLMIKNIEGVRAKDSGNTSNTIDMLKLQVGLNVGSSPVDVNQVVVSITDGTVAHNLVYAGNVKTYGQMAGFSDSDATVNLKALLTTPAAPTKYYSVDRIRDEDTSFSQANPVMNTGDLIIVYLSTTSPASATAAYEDMGSLDAGAALVSSQLTLVPRTTVNIVMTPESGAATIAEFVTPSSYGVKETVQLYP